MIEDDREGYSSLYIHLYFDEGVIIARRRRNAGVVSKLLALLDSVTAEEMQNQLRYI